MNLHFFAGVNAEPVIFGIAPSFGFLDHMKMEAVHSGFSVKVPRQKFHSVGTFTETAQGTNTLVAESESAGPGPVGPAVFPFTEFVEPGLI